MNAHVKTVNLKRQYPVPVSRLFGAWVEPELAKGWLAPGSMKVGLIKIEPKVSGKFLVEMKEPSGESARMDGVIQNLNANEQLEIKWQWYDSTSATALSVTFSALSENESEMHLSHSGFKTMDEMQNHQNGWKACCEKLSKLMV